LSFWSKIGKAALGVGTTIGDIALDTTPLGTFLDLDDLVDKAESLFGKGKGSNKKEFVVASAKMALEALDRNERVEFGVKDWALLLDGIEEAIEASVKIRKATNWWN
jgi:uncharacterized protein (DUF1778 family)